MIWGLSFVFQNEGMKKLEPFTFNGIRMMLGSVALLPIVLSGNKKKNAELKTNKTKFLNKKEVIAIICVGLCLFAGSTLQQMAFLYIEAGKIGFITALYMLFVPIFALFMKKIPPFTVWIGIVLGIVGLYILCIGGKAEFSLGKGEILTLLCAVAYALHIIVIYKFSGDINVAKLSCGQFFVTGVLSLIFMAIFENPDIHSVFSATAPILYSGIMTCSVAFTLQIVGQKFTDPTVASMLLCLESVFSVIFSYFLIPEQQLKPNEYIGCLIMFIAIILAQIPVKKKKKGSE